MAARGADGLDAGTAEAGGAERWLVGELSSRWVMADEWGETEKGERNGEG